MVFTDLMHTTMNQEAWGNFLYANGADFLNEDGTASGLDTPEADRSNAVLYGSERKLLTIKGNAGRG